MRHHRNETKRIPAALAVVALLAVPGLVDAGLTLNYYPKAGSAPTVEHWPQTIFDSSDVVEVDTSKPDAFVVKRVLHGSMEVGGVVSFERCAPIDMNDRAVDTIRDILRAPIVERLLVDDTLPVENVDALAGYPVPSRKARFIAAIHRFPHKGVTHWGFTTQTVGGDLLLLRNDRVYTPVFVKEWNGKKHDRRLRHVWVPHPYFPQKKDLETALKKEISYKEDFLRVSRLPDVQARIAGLQDFVVQVGAKKRHSVYAHRAIESIAASGTIGTAYLRDNADKPLLAGYLNFIIHEQIERRDRTALPWLRKNIQWALSNSAILPWPKRYCDPDSDAERAILAFLCGGAHALAAFGEDADVPLIRASIAWQLAQGRYWWVSVFPFTLTEERVSHPFRSSPVPESDPLVMMSRTLMNDPVFRPYPPLNEGRIAKLRQVLHSWGQRYGRESIPGLLWVWAQDEDPDVFGTQKGIRPQIAHEALRALLGEDLGTSAMPYWTWYSDHVLRAKTARNGLYGSGPVSRVVGDTEASPASR